MNALIIIFLLSYVLYSINNDIKFLFIYASIVGIYTLLTQKLFYKTPWTKFRNVSTVASWGAPNDPHIYGKIILDITKIESYLADLSKKLNKKLTLTLFSIKLIAIVLQKYPQLNAYIKYGKLNEKPQVDICCLVQVGDGDDLANSVIRNCSHKSLGAIHDELVDNVKQLQTRKNMDHNQKNIFATHVPNFLLACMIQVFSYIGSIGIGLKMFGVS
jgi:hypothetical protein